MHNADREATPTSTRALLGLLSRRGFSQRAATQPSDQSFNGLIDAELICRADLPVMETIDSGLDD
ncbi:MAG: hypothetical protein HC800_16840 [Phormidesmis sp. RL_2_1]|nr:hypothetical protein [Phormidesmis sp. RL_2_1]